MDHRNKYIDLAKKLKALSDQGVGGEKVNAKIKLEKLMSEHGITREDIEGIETKIYWFTIDPLFENFFWQIVANVCGIKAEQWNVKGKKKCKGVKCTSAEAIEIDAKQIFYLPIYKKEHDIFYKAFIQANELWAKQEGESDKRRTPLTDDDKKMLRMTDSMDKHHFAKQLNAPKNKPL